MISYLGNDSYFVPIKGMFHALFDSFLKTNIIQTSQVTKIKICILKQLKKMMKEERDAAVVENKKPARGC